MTEPILTLDANQESSVRSESLSALIWRRFKRHRIALYAIVLLAFIIMLVLAAPLTGYSPTELDPKNQFEPPSTDHWLGTDELGRDVFTRILYGGQISIAVGIFSTLFALMFGVFIGALAGFYGGRLDNILMRITDTFLILPVVFVLIIFSALVREGLPWLGNYRNSVWVVIFAIGIFAWMLPARISRGLFLVLREREFVSASRALGASDAPLKI